jgi:hypothetical protein
MGPRLGMEMEKKKELEKEKEKEKEKERGETNSVTLTNIVILTNGEEDLQCLTMTMERNTMTIIQIKMIWKMIGIEGAINDRCSSLRVILNNAAEIVQETTKQSLTIKLLFLIEYLMTAHLPAES